LSARRTYMHRLQDLICLHRQGEGSRVIARQLRMGRETIRTYLRALKEAELLDGSADALPELEILQQALAARLPPRPAPQQESSIEAWSEMIEAMHGRRAGAKAIFDRLRLEHPDFPGSLSAVKRMCARLGRERGIAPDEVAIPVETEAGHIAQVDFSYVGKLYDPEQGVLRKCWLFLMTLGHSRHLYCQLVFDQRVETWIRLHIEAFEAFGGVPRVIVPDNLKAAVIRAAFAVDDEPAIHRTYRELARHYGFQVDPAPPRSPEKKGKVESNAKYVKGNFFAPREPSDVVRARVDLHLWVREIAGQRVHGTTGLRPLAVFEAEERAALLALPATRYELVVWKRAQLHRDCHVQSTAPSTRHPGSWSETSCGRAAPSATSPCTTATSACGCTRGCRAGSAARSRRTSPRAAGNCVIAAPSTGWCARRRSARRRCSWSRRSSPPTTCS